LNVIEIERQRENKEYRHSIEEVKSGLLNEINNLNAQKSQDEEIFSSKIKKLEDILSKNSIQLNELTNENDALKSDIVIFEDRILSQNLQEINEKYAQLQHSNDISVIYID
jgi:hypothetical protein